MKDNEIIKALEWCEQFENNIVMSNRSGEKFILALQAMQIIKQALKEYTRQKAEIKSLTENLEALGDPLQDAHYKIAEQQAEIERLKARNDVLNALNKAASIEAIKEITDGLVTMFLNINESLNCEDIVENIKRFSSRLTEGRENG